MQKFLIAAALVTTTISAQAADLPSKIAFKKAPVAATTYDWTGFYAGVNAGLAVGGEGRSGLDVLGFGGSFETFNLASLGVVGGGQAGYNYQFGNWVIGAEADIQGIGTENHANCILTCNAATSAVLRQDMTWFGTVRGRVGYASGPILNYFTGGLAYGGVKVSDTERLAGANVGSFAVEQTRTGFALGSGIEAALGGNWTAKIEYLYVDLGSINQAFVLGGTSHVLGTEVRQSIFRAGVNYHIGGNAACLHSRLPRTGPASTPAATVVQASRATPRPTASCPARHSTTASTSRRAVTMAACRPVTTGSAATSCTALRATSSIRRRRPIEAACSPARQRPRLSIGRSWTG